MGLYNAPEQFHRHQMQLNVLTGTHFQGWRSYHSAEVHSAYSTWLADMAAYIYVHDHEQITVLVWLDFMAYQPL